jgi:hypothetical protein
LLLQRKAARDRNSGMNRFLKYWRLTKRGDAFRAHANLAVGHPQFHPLQHSSAAAILSSSRETISVLGD